MTTTETHTGFLALKDDTGAGTVTILGTIFVMLSLLTATLVLTHAIVCAARAGSAADLAALGAADSARGLMTTEPCTIAEQTATKHGAQLSECTIQEPGVVLITVQVPSSLDAVSWNATAQARGGPPPTPHNQGEETQ